MENKEAKKTSETEVSDNTINDTHVVKESAVVNSTDHGHNKSRSPGKDRGGDRYK